MDTIPVSPAPSQNRLLNFLAKKDYQKITPLLKRVDLVFKQVLNEPCSRIGYVYFPNRGVVSAVTIMADGGSIEVATIGNEGMVGLPAALEQGESTHRMIVQVSGEAWRMEAKALRTEMESRGSLRNLLVRYHSAFNFQISQSVACNGLHTVSQRCCRWVLMTHDRALADEFPLTHEFLSHMLGVRRVSVTDVLKPLQDAGLIRNHRGQVSILDRKGLEDASCECYSAVTAEFARLFKDWKQ